MERVIRFIEQHSGNHSEPHPMAIFSAILPQPLDIGKPQDARENAKGAQA